MAGTSGASAARSRASSESSVLATARELTASLSDTERAAVFGGNARTVYGF